jgi:hypothetical protein
VNFGEAVLVARDAMAANAHFSFLFASSHITCDTLSLGGHGGSDEGRCSDNGTSDRGLQCVHFPSTMGDGLIKINF